MDDLAGQRIIAGLQNQMASGPGYRRAFETYCEQLIRHLPD